MFAGVGQILWICRAGACPPPAPSVIGQRAAGGQPPPYTNIDRFRRPSTRMAEPMTASVEYRKVGEHLWYRGPPWQGREACERIHEGRSAMIRRAFVLLSL